MLGRVRNRYGWMVLLLAGCGGMLPPPPPPKMRSAPAAAPVAAKDDAKGISSAPRGPNSAPEHFKVKFNTTKGDFVVDVHRHWAPLGADRFHQLVKEGFYDGCKFFRVIPGFVVQFGINGDPAVNGKYQENKIPDDRFSKPNVRGTITFATSGENSRTSQLFISVGDNSAGGKSDLDAQKFTPFGHVIEGLEEVVDSISSEYDEKEINQKMIANVGNVYLDERFPNLDYIITARVVEADGAPAGDSASKPAAEKPPHDDKAAETKPAGG